MSSAIEMVLERIRQAQGSPDFLDILFGEHKASALQGVPVVIYGAGACGAELCTALRNQGVQPLGFCDSDESKSGTTYCGLPIIPCSDLATLPEALVLIAAYKYRQAIADRLLGFGVQAGRILCGPSASYASMVYMYAMVGTQALLSDYLIACGSQTVLDLYLEHGREVQAAYDLLADDHSRGLLVAKLALMASGGSFELFKGFIETYSQPLRDFGYGNYDGTPEDFYYFNNDVLKLSSGEVLVDVGAFDGDTVTAFAEACAKRGLRYRQVHAFEPDPRCFQALLQNTKHLEDIVCQPMGVWSRNQILRFNTSENALHDQAAVIAQSGNIEIQVVSIDDYLQGADVTFIKMDPGGNIIPQALRGAALTIAAQKPKLALGAYHGPKSLFEIPLLVHELCSDYRIFLRHNTCHLCDTDLLAMVP